MDRQKIKRALPHGFQSEIAKNLGVSFKCVNDYFRGVTNSKRIELASLEYLATYLEQKRVLENKIKSML